MNDTFLNTLGSNQVFMDAEVTLRKLRQVELENINLKLELRIARRNNVLLFISMMLLAMADTYFRFF